MDEMIGNIREVFVSNLHNLTWMDEETKKAAEEKVRLSTGERKIPHSVKCDLGRWSKHPS